MHSVMAGLCIRNVPYSSPKHGVREGSEKDVSSEMLFHASDSTEKLRTLFH